MASTIFNLGAVKLLKKILRFQESDIQIITGNSADPTSTAIDAVAGSLYLRAGTGELYIKQDSGLTTNFLLTSTNADLADYVALTEKGAANGVATLDAGGKIPVAQLPSAVMTYEGVWNALTNTPSLVDGSGDAGMVYLTSVAGTHDFGSGAITFAVGDWVVYNGTVWQKSSNTNSVLSVNGFTGVVVLDTDDIPEGLNLYFTDARARTAAVVNTLAGTETDQAPSVQATKNYIATQISASGAITSLTGDVTASGPGASAATLATVNSNVGSFGTATQVSTVTVNAKGLVTAASNTAIQIAESQVTNLTTDLAAKANTNLSNLATTSINQNLLPSANNVRNIGSSILRFASGFFNSLKIGSNTEITPAQEMPNSGATADALYTATPAINLGLFTATPDDAGPSASNSGDIYIETGRFNDVDSSGNTGSIRLRTGEQIGTGTRGNITFEGAVAFDAVNSVTGVPTPTVSSSAVPKTYVDTALALKANLASPALTGVPTAPTAAALTSTTQIATTAFVQGELAGKQNIGATTLVKATNASLTANTSNEVVTGLTFAHAVSNGCYIEYRIKKGTLVRAGRLLVATDGTQVALNDSFVETVDSTIVFEAVINGANINIRQTNTETGTISLTFEQNLYPV